MLAEVRELPVTTFAHWPLLPEALDLAVALDQTVYDCLYLALAEARDSVMVTADRRFHAAVSESIWADRICGSRTQPNACSQAAVLKSVWKGVRVWSMAQRTLMRRRARAMTAWWWRFPSRRLRS